MAITATFTDKSTPGPSGPITAWSWDFGDGGTSTVENPTHSYASAGTYTVTLEVTGTGADGTDTVTKSVTIVDPAALNASFTSSVSGLTVTLTDTSTPGPSGPITGWSWDFGDGNTATTQSPTHTYAAAGTYTVTLTVTGTSPDGTDTASLTFTVTATTSGSILFDGRATRLTSLVSYEDVYGDKTTLHQSQVKTSTKPGDDSSSKLWTSLQFLFSNVGRGIQLETDTHYTNVYKVVVKIGDSNPWQPPNSFLSMNKGAAQETIRRGNNLGNVDYYAIGTKVPSWSGNPAACEWCDFCSLGYQTSRGDQFAFRLQADSSSPTGLSYAVSANVGQATDPTVFNANAAWRKNLMPLVFNRWDEWVFGIKWATDNTGFVKIYHRVSGGSWATVLEKLNTPTYLWGTTTYGTFNQDGSNWTEVLDKLGLYYGRYSSDTIETAYETGLVRATTQAAAQATFP